MVAHADHGDFALGDASQGGLAHVADPVDARSGAEVGSRADVRFDALARSDGVRRGAGVPVEQHAVGERADDGDGLELVRIERQETVGVFEQHDGFLSDEPGEGAGLRLRPWLGRAGGADLAVGDAFRWIEQAEANRDAEEPAQGAVEVGLGDEPAFHRFGDGLFVAVEEMVDAGLEAGGSGGRQIGEGFVLIHEEVEAAAIGADDAVEAPLAADDVVEHRMHVSGRAVDGVVGGHEGAGATFAHGDLEALGVVLAPEALVEVG
ncbi:MAG: hypothetical protein BWX86_02839 [Verrucomicrobia bacterium ADurb.Bin122]|nr:MAG: hypothetical protein BWX86_02839 [Verrucomicrobia bacterium ADurb.Bin122]